MFSTLSTGVSKPERGFGILGIDSLMSTRIRTLDLGYELVDTIDREWK